MRMLLVASAPPKRSAWLPWLVASLVGVVVSIVLAFVPSGVLRGAGPALPTTPLPTRPAPPPIVAPPPSVPPPSAPSVERALEPIEAARDEVPDHALESEIDGDPVSLVYATIQPRGERVRRVLLSTHPIDCRTGDAGRPGEARVSLTLSQLLLERRQAHDPSARYVEPAERRWRVRRARWPAAIDEMASGEARLAPETLVPGAHVRLQLAYEGRFTVQHEDRRVRLRGAVTALVCPEAPSSAAPRPQPRFEAFVGSRRIEIMGATLRSTSQGDHLVLTSGPRSCSTRVGPWDVEVSFRPDIQQVMFGGDLLPSGLGIAGPGTYALEVTPGPSPDVVTVSITQTAATRLPLRFGGTVEALVCP